VLDSVPRCRWSRAELARLVGLAFVPFGTFFNMGFIRQRERRLAAA